MGKGIIASIKEVWIGIAVLIYLVLVTWVKLQAWEIRDLRFAEAVVIEVRGDHEVILDNGWVIRVESVYCDAFAIGNTITIEK